MNCSDREVGDDLRAALGIFSSDDQKTFNHTGYYLRRFCLFRSPLYFSFVFNFCLARL